MLDTSTPTFVPSSYRDLLKLGLPLIAAMGANSAMQFTDRLFLAHLGATELAAGFPAGMAAWIFQCVFITTAGYVSAFAAQHIGAKKPLQAGSALGPAFIVAIVGGLLGCTMIPLLPAIAPWFSSDQAVMDCFIDLSQWYFASTIFAVATAALSGFLAGIGRTGLVMLINSTQLLMNAALNACLIYGLGGFPRLGAVGAGIGTFTALAVTCVMAFAITYRRHIRLAYACHKPDFRWSSLTHFLYHAGPHGLRMQVEMGIWGGFTVAVARLGRDALAANNIVINWNMLTFLPMMGLAQAVAVAAGQAQGAGQPKLVRVIAKRGIVLLVGYAIVTGIIVVAGSDLLITMFAGADISADVRSLAHALFIIAALWGLGDAYNLVYTHILNGVGDTRWTLMANLIIGVVVLGIPTMWILQNTPSWNFGLPPVVALWSVTLGFILVIATATGLRFRSSRWENLRVNSDASQPT